MNRNHWHYQTEMGGTNRTELANYTVIPYDGLYFADSKLNIIDKGAYIKEPKRVPANGETHLRQLKQAVFYRKPLTDTVYQVIDRELYPKFKFDFGSDWLWLDPKSNVSMNRDIEIMLQGKKVYDVIPEIAGSYIMISYHTHPMSKQKGVIDRKNGKFYRFDMRKKNKEDFDLNFLQWEADRLVSFIAAYDFEEFMQNLSSDQWTVKGGFDLDEMLYSENPVLLRIKFKENMGR